MALSKNILVFIVMVSLFKVSVATDYIVGDSEGWTSMGGVDYKEWTFQKTFHVGDIIEFQYNNQFHNVKQVTEQDFLQCSPTSPISTYTTGSDKIVLEKPEHYYFLCGYPGHCEAGQKLDILVKPASSSRIASPPSNPTASSPPPSDKAEVDRIKGKVEECGKTLKSLGHAEFTYEDFFALFLEQLDSVIQGNEGSISHDELLARCQDESISDYGEPFVTSGEIRKRSEFFEPFILGLTNSTVEQCVHTYNVVCQLLIVMFFFNVFFSEICEDEEVRRSCLEDEEMIPETFVAKYGSFLRKSVQLKVPTGRKWKIRLSKRDGKIWLKHGWSEFMKYYSITYYYYLAFKYEGNSTLSVTIFNISATEIEYAFENECGPTLSSESADNDSVEYMGENVTRERKRDKSPIVYALNESENDESVKVLGEFVRPKRRDKSPVVCSRPRKSVKGNLTSTNEMDGEGTSAGLRSPKGNNTKTGMSPEKIVEKDNCVLRAGRFTSKSTRPFFTATMRPSYVLPNRQVTLYVKNSFARKHFLEEKGVVILHNSGTTWTVKYRCDSFNCMLFGDGWSSFVKDNLLKVDDICVFELDNTGQEMMLELEVSIFRHDEVDNCRKQSAVKCSQPEENPAIHIKSDIRDDYGHKFPSKAPGSSSELSPKETTTEVRRACVFKSKNPFFETLMKPSYVGGRSGFNLPLPFFKQHFNKKHREVTLTVSNGRKWTLPLIIGEQKASIGGKWKDFSTANSLKVRDICVFELIDKTQNSFNFIINPSSNTLED
ncbi:hypothetical protein ACFE04_022756 [Oxalis oulophora]